MDINKTGYKPVIGLEIHCQLLTKSKMYSSDPVAYGELPNTQISVITLAHPGTLPKINKEAVNHAIRLGISTHCNITKYNLFARKNYFYPDLPKGYQITQDKTPICTNGYITIRNKNGVKKNIGLIRIHLEEDAGKSLHDQDAFESLVDLNRAGVPLIEIVSKPDIQTSEEAHLFVSEIRKLVRYLDICDGNMEEGSLRCDANISVMDVNSTVLGTKIEVKNMNSFKHIRTAIDYEIERQINLLKAGEKLRQETRRFDAQTGKTILLRTKESSEDYRYFPEPDLPPVVITEEWTEDVKKKLPGLPDDLYQKYVNQFGLSHYDASVLTEQKEIAMFYEKIISFTNNYKTASNWVIGPVKSYLNEFGIHIDKYPVSPENLAELIRLIDSKIINNHIAEKQIYPEMIKFSGKSPSDMMKMLNIVQMEDESIIYEMIDKVLLKYPEKVSEYQKGKKGLIGLFVGEVMKMSKGKADPKKTNELILKKLENRK